MRIGIYTQQLRDNYGGILQNYALQQVLKKLGHDPITLDCRPRSNFFWYLVSQVKTIFLILIGKKRSFRKYNKIPQRSCYTTPFIQRYINTTWRMQFITPIVPYLLKIKCVITGSDQVWRPAYNNLSYAFLSFVKNKKIKKIAYAASFGVDFWEYSDIQTKECREWVKDFKAVSVREDSGVALCKNYLNINAIHVLDPTLLLSKDDYESLCSYVNPLSNKPFLVAYILDLSEEKENIVRNIAKEKGLEYIIVSAEKNINKTVEEWLSMFRDADYIVTDSFHGSIFSIIFQKPFNAIINSKRGENRFRSLLSLFDLEDRLISEDIDSFSTEDIDWSKIKNIHENWILKSINFLNKI